MQLLEDIESNYYHYICLGFIVVFLFFSQLGEPIYHDPFLFNTIKNKLTSSH